MWWCDPVHDARWRRTKRTPAVAIPLARAHFSSLYQWIKRSCACAASTAALLALAGCGFQPLYGEGSPAAEMVGRVAVAPLDGEGEAGFALRERLTERLGPATAPTHRLEVDLELESEGVALTQDDLTTRFNVT